MGAYRKLDVGPLFDFIEGRGGIYEVCRVGDPKARFVDAPGPSHPWWRWAQSGLRDARNKGYVTELWADRFCVRVLRVNPVSVWGDAWWGDEEDVA